MMDDDEIPGAGGKNKLPKVAKVKNKMPAALQITAEQLLREAKERELELVQAPPKQKISDPAELEAYKLRKRKLFEDNIRKNRTVLSNWFKYASWEASQNEIQRSRSVYERALDVNHRCVSLWMKYAEMEMKNRQVNHARNLWDRAVTILPRATQFWYKYTYMEEMLKNIAGARQVFERWMEWEPEEQAWHSYINFELRYKEHNRARNIYERFVLVHPEVKNWIKYARFEEKLGYISSARSIFERAVEFFGEDNLDPKLMVAFAKFEENQREHDRVRVIYKYTLDNLPKEDCQEIYKNYTIHEKKYGDRAGIEDVIVSKRKFQYEEEVKSNPHNYDAWFDYLRLMESDGEEEQVRETYERAISNVPPSREKKHWRRYIYLWINYAIYEELETENIERTRDVYSACLRLLPHKVFTFSKIWLLFAQFEVRQKNLQSARKILGNAIGKCPKDKLFRGYIELEIQLREFERCRILYEKFLQFSPENCTTWMKYSELETILGDIDRARAIYELAISQPRLDMPEVLWKSYIDFEIEQDETDKTRSLYRRLLQRTNHVKVWISFAQFEMSSASDDSMSRTRQIYDEAAGQLQSSQQKEERLMLLESWKEFEYEHGNEKTQEKVEKLMPKRVKKRRKVQTDEGADAGWEEYFDFIFPDDVAAQPNLKLLAIAKQWKEKNTSDGDDSDGDDSDGDDSGEDDSDSSKRSGDDSSDEEESKSLTTSELQRASKRLQQSSDSSSESSSESESSDSSTTDESSDEEPQQKRIKTSAVSSVKSSIKDVSSDAQPVSSPVSTSPVTSPKRTPESLSPTIPSRSSKAPVERSSPSPTENSDNEVSQQNKPLSTLIPPPPSVQFSDLPSISDIPVPPSLDVSSIPVPE